MRLSQDGVNSNQQQLRTTRPTARLSYQGSDVLISKYLKATREARENE